MKPLPHLALVALLAGCSGSIFDRPLGGSVLPPDAGSSRALGALAPAHVRRLSVTELKNSMRDLFGIDAAGFPSASFPIEVSQGTLENDSQSLSATDAFTAPLQEAAEWAAAAAAARGPALVPCEVAVQGEPTCALAWLELLGPRVYRRPLSTTEHAQLLAVYTTTRATEDFTTSIATLLEAMLQSPAFLYRTELGLTPYELAGALSYFLWQSTPDEALLDAARSGTLGVEAQVKRMVEDPRASIAAQTFFIEWLGMTTTAQMAKTDAAFSPALARSMAREASVFLQTRVWDGPTGFSDFFQGTSGFVDANLAPLYGVAAPLDGGMQEVPLDPASHAGFLTTLGFIATHTPGRDRSPIQLGHFIRTSVLCQALAPPPPGVPPPPADLNLDVHARFIQHDSDPTCQPCHRLMDPLGYGWSQYDVLGRRVPLDHGVAEDGAGELIATDIDGKFSGPRGLGARLYASPAVRACFADTVARWALGRTVQGSDETSADATLRREALASGFAEGDMKKLFAAIAQSPLFSARDTRGVPDGGAP